VNTLRCIVNLEQIQITPVTIGVRIQQINQDKAINLLATNTYVKFLWRTFGDHNLTIVAFCPQGKEGLLIQDLRAILEDLNAEHISVSVGFAWEKMSYSIFDDQSEIEEEIAASHAQIIENRY